MEIRLIGKTYEPIFNPYVFANSNNVLTIIGGEIFDKYIPFLNFNYIHLTGSKYLQTIDLYKNAIKTKNMTRNLKHSVFNQILDVISIGDNKYFMQLKSIWGITNAMIFDAKKINHIKSKELYLITRPSFELPA